jgi:hypothetical protein
MPLLITVGYFSLTRFHVLRERILCPFWTCQYYKAIREGAFQNTNFSLKNYFIQRYYLNSFDALVTKKNGSGWKIDNYSSRFPVSYSLIISELRKYALGGVLQIIEFCNNAQCD